MIGTGWWWTLGSDVGLLLLALTIDRVLPEPPEPTHPVVWLGKLINNIERLAPSTAPLAFVFGAGAVVLVVGTWMAASLLVVDVLGRMAIPLYIIGGALLLRTGFTVRGLVVAAEAVRRSLAAGRIDIARSRLIMLVGRNRSSLDPQMASAAAIESVAENTTDSFIAPWLMFALFGVPGAIAYRAINTFDSMWGKRGRYEYLGKFAAHLDDVVNYVPARLSGMLMLGAGATRGFPWHRGMSVMVRDRHITESPNAGWTMSAMAGLLGRRLEKQGHYVLGGEFPAPMGEDIHTANNLAIGTAWLGVVLVLGILVIRHWVIG